MNENYTCKYNQRKPWKISETTSKQLLNMMPIIFCTKLTELEKEIIRASYNFTCDITQDCRQSFFQFLFCFDARVWVQGISSKP